MQLKSAGQQKNPLKNNNLIYSTEFVINILKNTFLIFDVQASLQPHISAPGHLINRNTFVVIEDEVNKCLAYNAEEALNNEHINRLPPT